MKQDNVRNVEVLKPAPWTKDSLEPLEELIVKFLKEVETKEVWLRYEIEDELMKLLRDLTKN